MRYYRYSRWDGSQQIAPFDPEELLEQLSDDLLADGEGLFVQLKPGQP